MSTEGKEKLAGGHLTPQGLVLPPGREPLYDNITPGADHPVGPEARGGFGDRDGKEGFGSTTGIGASAIGSNEGGTDDDPELPHLGRSHQGDGIPSIADMDRPGYEESNESEESAQERLEQSDDLEQIEED
jgi:hypothetical protein